MSASEIKASGSERKGDVERTQGGGYDHNRVEEPPLSFCLASYPVRLLTEALHSPEQSQSHRSNPFEHVSLL